MYAGKEIARALAKGSLEEAECSSVLHDLSEEEQLRLEAKVAELEANYDIVGQVCGHRGCHMLKVYDYDTHAMHIAWELQCAWARDGCVSQCRQHGMVYACTHDWVCAVSEYWPSGHEMLTSLALK